MRFSFLVQGNTPPGLILTRVAAVRLGREYKASGKIENVPVSMRHVPKKLERTRKVRISLDLFRLLLQPFNWYFNGLCEKKILKVSRSFVPSVFPFRFFLVVDSLVRRARRKDEGINGSYRTLCRNRTLPFFTAISSKVWQLRRWTWREVELTPFWMRTIVRSVKRHWL